jgi:hypothetical protein
MQMQPGLSPTKSTPAVDATQRAAITVRRSLALVFVFLFFQPAQV